MKDINKIIEEFFKTCNLEEDFDGTVIFYNDNLHSILRLGFCITFKNQYHDAYLSILDIDKSLSTLDVEDFKDDIAATFPKLSIDGKTAVLINKKGVFLSDLYSIVALDIDSDCNEKSEKILSASKQTYQDKIIKNIYLTANDENKTINMIYLQRKFLSNIFIQQLDQDITNITFLFTTVKENASDICEVIYFNITIKRNDEGEYEVI